mmetsp:Transcript_19809/g.67001  ORF Transcript_19809/g.67001 Transcript_19809/m.67001 type:complete len:233 (+) Transcript_19809:785-1483(+)
MASLPRRRAPPRFGGRRLRGGAATADARRRLAPRRGVFARDALLANVSALARLPGDAHLCLVCRIRRRRRLDDQRRLDDDARRRVAGGGRRGDAFAFTGSTRRRRAFTSACVRTRHARETRRVLWIFSAALPRLFGRRARRFRFRPRSASRRRPGQPHDEQRPRPRAHAAHLHRRLVGRRRFGSVGAKRGRGSRVHLAREGPRRFGRRRRSHLALRLSAARRPRHRFSLFSR